MKNIDQAEESRGNCFSSVTKNQSKSGRLTSAGRLSGSILSSQKRDRFGGEAIDLREMPIVEPSHLLRGKVLRNHGDGLFLELLGRTRVLERAILPSALTALAGEIGTYLVRHVLGENIRHLGCCKRMEHTHVSPQKPNFSES